jgi:hypothetical protein
VRDLTVPPAAGEPASERASEAAVVEAMCGRFTGDAGRRVRRASGGSEVPLAGIGFDHFRGGG